ncbi:MAG: aldehyde dehydrogenase family protein [Burkholderiaceae bacterium]|nr:aldehyde dehydrogenase family protein [Burkholderiaceae bacterium]
MKFDASVKTPDLIYVGGRWTKPSTDAKIDVINCGTEEHFLSVAEAKEADVNAAVAAARSAFDGARGRA